MKRRFTSGIAFFALALPVVLAACKGDTEPDPPMVQVQLLNGTNFAYELRRAGQVAPGTVAAGFGGSSGCTSVDLRNPNLTVTPPGSSTPMDAISSLGGSAQSYVIVAYPLNAGMGLTYQADPKSTPGEADLQIFNASDRAIDVYVTAPGAAAGTPTRTFLSVGSPTQTPIALAPGQYQVRFTTAGSQTFIGDAGNVTLTSGQRLNVVVATPLNGQTTLRTFVAGACS